MTKKYNEIEAKNNMHLETETQEEDNVVREKKPVETIVSVKPVKAKRGLLGRLATALIGPDGLPGIGAYVNDEIVKPAIKNIIVDAVTSGINMVMYGDKGGGGYRGPQRSYQQGHQVYRPNVNYGNNYKPAPMQHNEQDDRYAPRTMRDGVQNYILTDRFDASNVLTKLTEYADRYDTVSVADYYEMIGVESKFTDNNYGWGIDSIIRATIQPVRGGFVIKFPPVEVI